MRDQVDASVSERLTLSQNPCQHAVDDADYDEHGRLLDLNDTDSDDSENDEASAIVVAKKRRISDVM